MCCNVRRRWLRNEIFYQLGVILVINGYFIASILVSTLLELSITYNLKVDNFILK